MPVYEINFSCHTSIYQLSSLLPPLFLQPGRKSPYPIIIHQQDNREPDVV